MWQTPVVDRTQDDVDFARANRGDAALYKGAQNYTDWNRLANNMYHLANILTNNGFTISLSSKYNWQLGDIPSVSEIDQIKTDLQKLRYSLYGFFNYTVSEWDGFGRTVSEIDARGETAESYFSKLPLPHLPYTHFQKINDIEEISLRLYKVGAAIQDLYRYSGTFSAGQVSYLPHFISLVSEFMTVQEFNSLLRTVAQIDAEQRAAADFFRRY